MTCYLTSLYKSENPFEYARKANSGMMLGFPVKIGGQDARPDNNIHYHSTIKVFNPTSDHLHEVHHLAKHLILNPPDPKTTQIEPATFQGKNGDTIHVIKLHGRSADKIKEYNGKFAHMGDSVPYEFQPHVSVDRDTWDKIKSSGAKTAHEAGISFGNAELKRGPKTIKTYHHQPDSSEPMVPDEGDITAKIPYEPQFNKSELCPLHKAEMEQTDEDAHALLNRREDKYFLPRRHLETVISELSTRFALGDIDTDTRYCRNKTIYLDDKDLSSMRDVVSRKTPRTKVRIRQYSPNNQGWEQVAYAEFKIKEEDGQSKKIRVRISAAFIDELANGGKIIFDESLVNINRDIDRRILESRVQAINHSISRSGLRKQLEVQYERRAYSGKNLRITIDDDLNFFNAAEIDPTVKASMDKEENWSRFIKPYLFAAWENPLVLEVKSGENVPHWLDKLLKEVGAEATRFSKYAAAMVTHLKTSEKNGKILSVFDDSPTEMTKSEKELIPLMKPFVSEAQRRWGNSPSGKKALGGEAGVHEWNEATKGKKLPEKVAKSEKENCFACGKTLKGEKRHKVDTRDDQIVHVGPECLKKIHAAGEEGYQPIGVGPKLYKLKEKDLNKSEQPLSPKPSIKINPEHGKNIANTYESMKHDPHHPDVKAAYSALIGETNNQFKDLMGKGLKISKIKPGQPNPYKSSKDMHQDVKNNNHLHYFPTDQGFGDTEQHKDHPMLAHSGYSHEGQPLLANDVFRIVHDINGHHAGGESGFGPTGEHQAYLTHKKMYSPLANKALFTETAGQNNYVNHGPNAEWNKKNPTQTKFAEQKAGLMPDSIINGKWHNET